MTILILVSLLQRVSPKLSLPLGSAWLPWQICQCRSQFESKIRFDLETKIEPELQYCVFRCDCKLLSKTGPNRTLLWIHPLIRVPSWSRGIENSRHKGWFPTSLGDWRAKKKCPISTSVKPALEHSVDNFWSSGNFSNRCSYSCSKFPCCSSLACVSARGGCVRISTLSSWPGALVVTTALWPTGHSSIISATAPWILSWLTEMIIWRSTSMLWVLHFPLPLLLNSPLSKALVPRNTRRPDPAKFSSFAFYLQQDPSGLWS